LNSVHAFKVFIETQAINHDMEQEASSTQAALPVATAQHSAATGAWTCCAAGAGHGAAVKGLKPHIQAALDCFQIPWAS
jgi:hypothetical protein